MEVVANKNIVSFELENMIESLDRFKERFVEDTIHFYKVWNLSIANHFWDHFSEISDKYSKEQKEDFFYQIDVLNKDTTAIVSLFDNTTLWWHYDSTRTFDRNTYKDITDFIPSEFRFILGKIGKILNNFRFIPKSEKPVYGFSVQKDGENVYQFFYQNPYYPSDSMKRSMDQYWEYFKQASLLTKKLSN